MIYDLFDFILTSDSKGLDVDFSSLKGKPGQIVLRSYFAQICISVLFFFKHFTAVQAFMLGQVVVCFIQILYNL